MPVKPLKKKSSSNDEEEKPSKETSTKSEFVDIAEIGEIVTDSSSKSVIKVRVVEITDKTGKKSRLLDIRKHVLPTKGDKSKWFGPTKNGVGLPFDQVEEARDLLTEFLDNRAQYEGNAAKKAAKKAKKAE